MRILFSISFFFFFQAEDGIRDLTVTGVQTCALPICVNVVKKHKRATGAPGSESGIIEFPAPIAASNVMLLDPKSGEPTRVRRRRDKDGTVERIAIKSGQPIPRAREECSRRKNRASPSRPLP